MITLSITSGDLSYLISDPTIDGKVGRGQYFLGGGEGVGREADSIARTNFLKTKLFLKILFLDWQIHMFLLVGGEWGER